MDSWEESHRYWGCKAASLSQVLRYTPPLWLKRVTELLQFHVLNRQGLPHCAGAPGRQETKATKHGNPRPLGLTVWWCTCACTHAHTCARVHVCTCARACMHTHSTQKSAQACMYQWLTLGGLTSWFSNFMIGRLPCFSLSLQSSIYYQTFNISHTL